MGRRVGAFLVVVALGGLAACAPKPPPPPPPPNAGIIAFGDAGSGDANQHAVADRMEVWAASHRVDALVEAGDNVYPDGHPSRFAATLDEPYAQLRQTRPFWVALGNHDVHAGWGDEQLDYLGLPDPPFAKSLNGVQLLFLDSNNINTAQAQWVDTMLSMPGPKLRIIVFHHSPYECSGHGNDPAVIQQWVPIFEKHRVALVVTGHGHYYERFRSANGVTYLVTGGGGAELYPKIVCVGTPPSQDWAVVHHFVGIEITGRTLKLTTISKGGTVIDTATITR